MHGSNRDRRLFKKAVQQGRSERRGEEVRISLCVPVRHAMDLGERKTPFSDSDIRGAERYTLSL
jgi:hypothetical protein